MLNFTELLTTFTNTNTQHYRTLLDFTTLLQDSARLYTTFTKNNTQIYKALHTYKPLHMYTLVQYFIKLQNSHTYNNNTNLQNNTLQIAHALYKKFEKELYTTLQNSTQLYIALQAYTMLHTI